ncbi:MAG: hypothetical protein ACI9GW_003401 [Halieaceae bacterium]
MSSTVRHIITHGHIFKNAGTTLDWSLARNFGAGFLDHRDDAAMRADGPAHLAQIVQDQPELQAISSHHMVYPLPAIRGVSFVPVYLLRHPIERIASVYTFERQQDADTPGAEMAKKTSFVEYVKWRMRADVPRTIRDYQCFNLAGCKRGGGGMLPRTILLEALEQVDRNPCIGVVDRYDESMVALEVVLAESGFADIDLAYLHQNATRKVHGVSLGKRVQRVGKDLGELLAEVIDANSYDLALYRLANQRLDQMIAGIEGFEGKMESFKRRCRALC